MKARSAKQARQVRHRRLRQRFAGTAQRPRMAVMVSNRHMSVQFIDDDRAVTLAAVTTMGKGGLPGHNVATARELGRRAAEAAKGKGIEVVVLDRGGFRYHGRVQAIADAVREGGLRI